VGAGSCKVIVGLIMKLKTFCLSAIVLLAATLTVVAAEPNGTNSTPPAELKTKPEPAKAPTVCEKLYVRSC
jgi:hypothetical protein